MSRAYILIKTDIGTPDQRPIVAFGSYTAEEAAMMEVLEGAIAVPNTEGGLSLYWRGSEYDGRSYNEATGGVTDRPQLPGLSGGPAPLAVPLGGYPAGTTLRVTNEAGDAIEIGITEDLTLTDPGIYRISATAPWPWLPLDAEIEVT